MVRGGQINIIMSFLCFREDIEILSFDNLFFAVNAN